MMKMADLFAGIGGQSNGAVMAVDILPPVRRGFLLRDGDAPPQQCFGQR